MAVRQGLLALLEREPMYGYQLRSEFEAATGSAWPLNIGQVYTTLSRLERDGAVEPTGPPGDDGRVVYRITDAGRAELDKWFATPVDRAETRPRDELVIKLAMSLTTPGVDARAVIDAQRAASMRVLQQLTRQKLKEGDGDPAALLVLEAAIFAAEAEVRWLDHCDATVGERRPAPQRGGRHARRSYGAGELP
jgi:DNA-binding PadR family transcriptional regulator